MSMSKLQRIVGEHQVPELSELYNEGAARELLGDFTHETNLLPLMQSHQWPDLRLLELSGDALKPLEALNRVLGYQRHTALLGPTACGKTSTIFNSTIDHDCIGHEARWVIFFDCVRPNEFSAEIDATPGNINRLVADMLRCTDDVDAFALVAAYVLANVALLLKLRAVYPDVTPREYLRYQLNPGREFVENVYAKLKDCSPTDVAYVLREAVKELHLEGVAPLVVIDEANIGMQMGPLQFHRLLWDGPLALTTGLKDRASLGGMNAVLAGASFRLTKEDVILPPYGIGAGKPAAMFVFQFGPGADSARHRLEQLINLVDVDLDGLQQQLALLEGRPGFALAVITNLIAQRTEHVGKSKQERFELALAAAIDEIQQTFTDCISRTEHLTRENTAQGALSILCNPGLQLGMYDIPGARWEPFAGQMLESGLFYACNARTYKLTDPLCKRYALDLVLEAGATVFAARDDVACGRFMACLLAEAFVLRGQAPAEWGDFPVVRWESVAKAEEVPALLEPGTLVLGPDLMRLLSADGSTLLAIELTWCTSGVPAVHDDAEAAELSLLPMSICLRRIQPSDESLPDGGVLVDRLDEFLGLLHDTQRERAARFLASASQAQ